MLSKRIENALEQFAKQDLLRQRFVIDHRDSHCVEVESKALINFCSNDYLSIANHPEIKKAFIRAVEKYGLGSTSSAALSGHSKEHQALEEAFATFLNRKRALLFNSGYHANLGVLTTFAERNTAIIADKYCHASLIDGAVLSRATLLRYPHLDMQQAEQLLANNANKDRLLVSESIFSMQGDIVPLPSLASIAKTHQAMLIIDDAHGIGVLGKHGKGISECYAMNANDIQGLIVPFGKAIGSIGAIVAGDENIVEPLLQFARTYRYSTALPPAICAATLCALKIVAEENWRREKLARLIAFFIQQAEWRQLPLFSKDPTPIKSIIVGDNKKTLAIQKQLQARGFFVSCIREPTVPKNSACIRISLNYAHEESQILSLLDQLKECYDQN